MDFAEAVIGVKERLVALATEGQGDPQQASLVERGLPSVAAP